MPNGVSHGVIAPCGGSAGSVWAARRLRWLIVLTPALYIGSCSMSSYRYDQGFTAVSVRDAEQDVVRRLGTPSVRERADGAPVLEFATAPCVEPCHVRLWYTNAWSMAGEAWSFDLDRGGRVIAKARWVSP